MTTAGLGAAAARIRRAAEGRVRTWWLLVPVSPVITFLAVSRSWRAFAVVALAGLAVLAVCGPVAMLALIPLSLLGGILPAGTTITLAAVAAVALVAGVQFVAGTRRPRLAHLWIALFALVSVAAFVFPATGSVAEPDRLVDLFCLLAGLGLVAAVTGSPPPPGAVIRVTALAGGLAAAYVLLLGERVGGRLQGLSLNPNYLGAFLALPFVAAAGLAYRHRRPVWLLPAGACLAGMAATQSRGAFVAGVAGIAILVMQGRRIRIQALIAIVTIVAGMVFPTAIGVVERLAVGGREAAVLSHDTEVRERVAGFAARVAAGHPLRGIGYGMFPSYADSRFGVRIATHNDYLRLAAEMGVLALAAFLVLLWLGHKGPAPGDLAVPRAVTGTYAVGLLFANELTNLVVSTPFWLALGCLLASRNHISTAQGVHHDRR
ncbi:MAG TPA: O-antigen ligase family protein [Actinoallomurus sp.]|nr:O-antigen ligase family protein [Actinoallomurus sp.]